MPAGGSPGGVAGSMQARPEHACLSTDGACPRKGTTTHHSCVGELLFVEEAHLGRRPLPGWRERDGGRKVRGCWPALTCCHISVWVGLGLESKPPLTLVAAAVTEAEGPGQGVGEQSLEEPVILSWALLLRLRLPPQPPGLIRWFLESTLAFLLWEFPRADCEEWSAAPWLTGVSTPNVRVHRKFGQLEGSRALSGVLWMERYKDQSGPGVGSPLGPCHASRPPASSSLLCI